jgi:hypothetical protein
MRSVVLKNDTCGVRSKTKQETLNDVSQQNRRVVTLL